MFLSKAKFINSFAEREPDYGKVRAGYLREIDAGNERRVHAQSELIPAAYGAGQFVDNITAEMEARDLAYDRRIAAIHDATGVQLHNPYKERYDQSIVDRDYGGDMVAYFNSRPSKFQSQIDELAAKYPEQAGLITGNGKSPEQQGLEITAAAEGRYERALANPALGLGDRIGGSIIGYLAASARDPIQIAATFAGGGVVTGRTVAARIVKVMATEAVINAGLEAVLQVKAQNYRERAGLEYGLSDGLRNVGIAALFGAGLGGSVQGAREVVGAIKAKAGRKLSEAGEQALERAFAEELLPGDAERLTGELSAFLDIELNPRDAETVRRGFEQDAIDNDFVDGIGSSFAINSDPDDAARLPLGQAALRHANDPDNHLPPEVIEMQMADEIGNMPTFMNAEEYMLAYGLDAVDDPVASVISHAEGRFAKDIDDTFFDPIGEQQLRPVDVPDFTPAEGDLNFGTIEPELKQSLDEARAAAGDIVAPESKDIGELIGVSDENGNVKMISARQALDDAESGVHMADVLEACNL
ncbi:MAG: hypothetical protein JKY94_11070 [Rhodobacteraceae bacterium]|nr:hypothetical protein [Paracoccaceae bacterium]